MKDVVDCVDVMIEKTGKQYVYIRLPKRCCAHDAWQYTMPNRVQVPQANNSKPVDTKSNTKVSMHRKPKVASRNVGKPKMDLTPVSMHAKVSRCAHCNIL